MADYFRSLKKKIEKREAKLAIIGVGYIGLPLALAFTEKKFSVFALDIDEEKIKKLNREESYIGDIKNIEIKKALKNKFLPSNNFSLLKQSDVILVCVPTPLTKDRQPDMSHLQSVTDQIKKYFQKGQLIIYESTTYPCTCQDFILPQLEINDLKIEKDFFLVFAPERIDPGNKIFGIKNTPKVVGGKGPKSTELARILYSQIIEKIHPVSSAAAAEMTKILENTFRQVNIALINEMAMLCHDLNIDVWEVINAAATKPFGFGKAKDKTLFLPGPGIGGHCIPIDPLYLTWKMKTLNRTTRFINLADEINNKMPEYVIERLIELLNEKEKSLKEAKIYLIGVAYKPNISDLRESPAIPVIKNLLKKKALVCYFDPYVPKIKIDDIEFRSEKKMERKKISRADCVLILTAHSSINWQKLTTWSKLIFDTCNATAGIKRTKIVKL